MRPKNINFLTAVASVLLWDPKRGGMRFNSGSLSFSLNVTGESTCYFQIWQLFIVPQ